MINKKIDNNENKEYKPKSIYIDITKEDEEDKELISLIEGKRNSIYLN